MNYIAEIGWNFIGDLELAEQMVKAAKDSNATFAKFQIWNPDNLKKGPWDTDGRKEIYKKAFLDSKKIERLMGFCSQNGIKFLASVFELKSLDLLAEIKNDYVKIPSHECNNWKLIDRAINHFRNVYLSVGAISACELSEILKRYGHNDKVTIMHCVSTYPLESSKVNLPKLQRMKEECKKIGYSSHYTGIEDAIAATAVGATLIEKHFTTNRGLPGRDNKFALIPTQFKQMTEACQIVTQMMNDHGDGIQVLENDVANIMRGRWDGGA